MRTLSKLFFLVGAFIIFTSSCVIGSISDQISGAISGMDDGTLFTKKSYPIAAIKNVKVSTSGGSISVTGDANREVVLEMYVKPNNNRRLSENEIREILERDYEITLEQQGNTLVAIAKRKSGLNWKNAINISFVVHSGNNVATNLSTSGGSIQLAGLVGSQDFKTSGGSLKVQNLRGNINGSTSGGSIQASNSEGTIDLKTSGGSITLENLKGNINVSTSGGSIKGNSIDGSLSAKTSGGSINLSDIASKVNASTSGGSVTAELNELVGDLQLSTSAGSVNLTLPRNASATLDLKGMKVNANSLSNFNGTNSKGVLRGTINGGGTQVKASTSAGNVNLNFK